MEEDDKLASEPVVGLTYYKLSLALRQQEQYEAAVDAMSKYALLQHSLPQSYCQLRTEQSDHA